MLTPEPSDAGTQVTLRVSGFLRFLPAAFLAFWLCGWAVGEWFALRLFASMLRTLLGSSFLAAWFPPLGGRMPEGPGLPFFILFLTFWLTLWTIGGIGAFHELLASLFGRERVCWGGDALEIERSALLLVSRTRLPAQEITGFRLLRGSLVADTRQRATRVASLGSGEDRTQLLDLLQAWRASFPPPPPLPADESPVPTFLAFRDETGAIALRTRGPRLLAARESWHMGPTRLERRRVFLGRTWSTEFVPLELQLSCTTDSDGDTRWKLIATGAGRRHAIVSSLDDPNVPLTLGTWLAERTGARLVRRDLDATLRRAS